MNSKYEIIEHIANLPFSCYLWDGSEQPMNWHNDIEIIMILEGSLKVVIRGTESNMSKNDLLLINSNEIHHLKVDKSNKNHPVVLIYQFDPDFYQSYYPKFSDVSFHCNSAQLHKTPMSYEVLKKQLVKLMWLTLNKTETFQLEGLQVSLELCEYLIAHFSTTLINPTNSQDQIQQRLIRLIDYINKHYDKKINLDQLANIEFISPHYLSKFFKMHVGIGFNKYLNQFRINKSLNELLYTNKTILEIALDHGFSNSKSYTKHFKELYDSSPSDFRKRDDFHQYIQPNEGSKNSQRSQDVLLEYVEKNKKTADYGFIPVDPITVDCHQLTSDKFDFEKILYFDFVYDGLNSNWQNNLTKIQKEINFDYIRFNGIFNKGMFFYSKKELSYNWYNIDNLFDFFISINLIPFIELTYIESEYSLKNWHILLEEFLSHCVTKYGRQEVCTWKFELASEDKSYDQAISLYTSTLKKLSNNFDFLNLGILFSPAKDYEEREYLRNFKDKNIKFMSVEMTEDLYYKKQDLANQLFHNISVNMGLKLYYISVYKDNNLNDTCYDANAQVFNKLTNFNNIDTQVSFIDDLRNTKIFHGGLGLLTYNGLKKPIYNAYHLLNNLRGDVISRGDKHIVTQNNNIIRVLIHNYDEEAAKMYRKQKNLLSNQSYQSFKSIIDQNSSRLVTMSLKLDSGLYRIRSNTLNDKNGCIFTQWFTMGSPSKMNKEEFDYLKSKEYMKIEIATTEVVDSLIIEELLNSNEIKLLEIQKL